MKKSLILNKSQKKNKYKKNGKLMPFFYLTKYLKIIKNISKKNFKYCNFSPALYFVLPIFCLLH